MVDEEGWGGWGCLGKVRWLWISIGAAMWVPGLFLVDNKGTFSNGRGGIRGAHKG